MNAALATILMLKLLGEGHEPQTPKIREAKPEAYKEHIPKHLRKGKTPEELHQMRVDRRLGK